MIDETLTISGLSTASGSMGVQLNIEKRNKNDSISLLSLPSNSKDKNHMNNINYRTLVRQSTDLTSSFPLKSFQRINSETIEVPGLNVKVMRYRVSNDFGKIEPHLYINNIGGGDSCSVLAKGKLSFSVRFIENIKSLCVTIKKYVNIL